MGIRFKGCNYDNKEEATIEQQMAYIKKRNAKAVEYNRKKKQA